MNAMVDAMIAADPHLFIVSGDLYNHIVPWKSTPDERGVLFPALVRMAQHGPVAVVLGNHDHAEDLTGLSHLGGAWGIYVVTGADVLRVPTRAGIANLYCASYPTARWLLAGDPTPRSLVETRAAAGEAMAGLLASWAYRIRKARKANPDEPHILAAHFAVTGSQTAGGEVLGSNEVEVSRAALDALPVDFGNVGHIHYRQQVAERCSYPGSPWRNDFSEVEPFKGWSLAEIGPAAMSRPRGPDAWVYPATTERQACVVHAVPNPCRTFATLDYRYGADLDTNIPRWITRPTDAAIAACKDAEVRMRLVVSEQWVGGAPWDDEVARISALAVRVQVERVIEPVIRIRAPLVASAVTPADKLAAYWQTLATMPSEAEQASARACLDEVAHAG